MKSKIETELNEINETTESLYELNQLIYRWAEKRGWYIFINRINKKGWVVYGLKNGGEQLMNYCGLSTIEKYFDSPVTSLNNFINTKF